MEARACDRGELEMDSANGMAGRHQYSRRQLLRDMVTSGVSVAATATLPASADEKTEFATVRSPATKSGSVAETLADFAIRLRYEDLPGDVIRSVKRTILDTIGCAFGGYGAEPSQI